MDSLIMPLFDVFFSNKNFEQKLGFYMNLLNDFSQISKFENSKKARRR